MNDDMLEALCCKESRETCTNKSCVYHRYRDCVAVRLNNASTYVAYLQDKINELHKNMEDTAEAYTKALNSFVHQFSQLPSMRYTVWDTRTGTYIPEIDAATPMEAYQRLLAERGYSAHSKRYMIGLMPKKKEVKGK